MPNESSTTFTTSGLASDDAGVLQRGVHQAGDSLHSGIDRMAQPVHAAVAKASASAHQTVERVAGGMTAAVQKVDARTRDLQQMPQRAADQARNYVRERPLQTVCAALLVGWLVGRFGAAGRRD